MYTDTSHNQLEWLKEIPAVYYLLGICLSDQNVVIVCAPQMFLG